jgi:hypothetical protein
LPKERKRDREEVNVGNHIEDYDNENVDRRICWLAELYKNIFSIKEEYRI